MKGASERFERGRILEVLEVDLAPEFLRDQRKQGHLGNGVPFAHAGRTGGLIPSGIQLRKDEGKAVSQLLFDVIGHSGMSCQTIGGEGPLTNVAHSNEPGSKATMADILLKRGTKRAARALFHHAGGTRWVRSRFGHSVRILMYHRFPQESRFEAQCAHLRKHYQPVSLSEAVACLGAGKPIPGHLVVVTVDDGYRDVLQNAFPILNQYRIPATVFLTTDLPDRLSWLWTSQVTYCVERSRVSGIALGEGGKEQWMLDTSERRERAARSITETLKKMPNTRRLEWVAKLPSVLGVDLPQEAPDSHAPLRWDDVRTLSGSNVEFGAHTRTHPILSRLATLNELEAEIAGSRGRIEQETGVEVRHFCYPNGTPADISEQAVEVVRASGFVSAVTATSGVNRAGADMFRLRRIGVTPGDEDLSFQLAVAGRGIRG